MTVVGVKTTTRMTMRRMWWRVMRSSMEFAILDMPPHTSIKILVCSPLSIMDQEVYYHIAKDTNVQYVLLLHIMVAILNAHHCLHALVGRWWKNIDTGIADAVAAAHVKMQHGKRWWTNYYCSWGGSRHMGTWLCSMQKTSLCSSAAGIAFIHAIFGIV